MQSVFHVTWFWKLLDTKYEMSGELACFPLKIMANGFFFLFLLSKVRILTNVKLRYHSISRSFAENKLILSVTECKSILCLLWNSFCLRVRDILHGWEPDHAVLNAGILWIGEEKESVIIGTYFFPLKSSHC